MNIYDKRNAFGVQQKEAVLVAFRISKLRELKNLGPWKLMKNFLILTILHTCQLFWIIGESPGYDNNLPVSRMGHKISRIKSSCELFYGLIWNSSHFLHVFGITPNVLLIVSVYSPVCTKGKFI